MLRHHLLIAIRHITRNRAFSIINVLGLAAGLTTCLLIMLYILDEKEYDQHHTNADRIYRIASRDNKDETWAALCQPLAAAMTAEMPEVEQATRLMTFPYIEKMLLRYKGGANETSRQFFERQGYYVDSNFFNVLTYHFIHGVPAQALNRPNTMVISQDLSRKFFGDTDPMGKVMVVATPFGDMNYTVQGVFDQSSGKSHIPANFLLSMRNQDMWNWVQQQTRWTTNNVFFTYVKLRAGTDPKNFIASLNALHERHAGAAMREDGFSKKLFLQPVKDIYLHSSLGNELAPNGNIAYLYILASIAIFTLAIACINFMNLSTARSQKRAREVGVRKVLGAGRGSLIRQFLGESFLLCLCSLGIALLLTQMLLPLFNGLAHKEIRIFSYPSLIGWISVLTILTGLLAGMYPSLYLSSFQPVRVLKGRLVNSLSATAIRKGLVVFQFTISICLVFAAIVIWQQLKFMQVTNLGFNKDQQLVLPLKQSAHADEGGYKKLRDALLEVPGINAVSWASGYPGNPDLSDMLFHAEDKRATDIVDINLAGIEPDYIRNLGFTLLKGREFSKGYLADSSAIILNETAVHQLGYSVANAVGRKINYDAAGMHGDLHIIGVVKDFNFQNLHHEVRPFGFTSGFLAGRYAYTIATLNTRNYAKVLTDVGAAWRRLNPETPFEYSFMDQDFQRNYEKERQSSQIVIYFTGIAIFIACLGLFGLASFMAEQRTREIGIRKVLGASISNVTVLLSRDFVRLVILAALIAMPVAWLVMHQWLGSFAYRTPVEWWFFALAGGLALVVAILTVSSQAVRAAVENPAKSLRSE